jgi:CheY-like chemotaxis protein
MEASTSNNSNVSTLVLRQTPISYRDLMKDRVNEILVVASLYDSFKLEEDGRLTELIFAEYQDMNFINAPHVNRVSSASQALKAMTEKHFDLVITMPRISDMDPFEFGRQMRKIRPELPVILLVASAKESNHYVEMDRLNPGAIDKIFYWTGNSAVLPAIIKYSEDKRNADRDILRGLVRAIIVVEDTPQYYSAFLPMIYREITRHTLQMMKQEYDDNLKLLRVRSRPRILLATTYEEGLAYFERYQKSILAVISDIKFCRGGKLDEQAGIRFLSTIQAREESVPLVLQSKNRDFEAKARKMRVRFFDKNSPNLMNDLRSFVIKHCGFDDLIMSTPEAKDSIVIRDLRSLEKALDVVTRESLEYHARRNHFSNWLAMRGYLEIAAEAKAFRDLDDMESLRGLLKRLVKEQRKKKHKEAIVDFFNPELYDPETRIVRIGDGSLGGKARGIVFVSIFIKRFDWGQRFPDINIEVPRTAVIATDIYDEFVQRNQIRERFSEHLDDEAIDGMFLKGDFDQAFSDLIKSYLEFNPGPMAVRSSSLLEDSVFQPFAGIYNTYMIPDENRIEQRLKRVLEAIKLVYASTFHHRARAYMDTTGNRFEDEKMAVILQAVVGEKHDGYFYPTLSGNLQTYNFYPLDKIRREDGITNVCLGLGRTVVNGEKSLRFSPRHPNVLLQFYDEQSIFRNTQSEFYALRLGSGSETLTGAEDQNLVRLPLEAAEKHGVLEAVGSVYSTDDKTFRETFHLAGPRIVTFANILKWKLFPLADLLKDMMSFGRRGMGCEVEVEFAANVSLNKAKKATFSILQIRPLITHSEVPLINLYRIDADDLVCESKVCLGNGLDRDICDMIVVRLDSFNAEATPEIAAEINELNKSFDRAHPYFLIGPGRWGSSDPQLGIPVNWGAISNVGAIAEVGLPDYHVEPSFGSHFFQNLTSLNISYFVTFPKNYAVNINFDWLNSCPATRETKYLRHLHFEEPITVQIDGKQGHGFVLKPGLFEKYKSLSSDDDSCT